MKRFILRLRSVVHTTSLNHTDPAISFFYFFAVLVLTIKFLSSSLLSLCSPSILPFVSFSFLQSLPSSTLSTLILNSPHVYSSLSPPLPLSNPFKPFHPFLLFYGSTPPSMPSGYLPLGSSLLLQSPKLLSQLTQQDDDAQQDGNQGPRTETRRGEERLALAHPDPAVALARAHPQGQGAGATQRRLPVVPHHDGQLVQFLGQVVETPPPGNDASRAVYNGKLKKRLFRLIRP